MAKSDIEILVLGSFLSAKKTQCCITDVILRSTKAKGITLNSVLVRVSKLLCKTSGRSARINLKKQEKKIPERMARSTGSKM
jgi:hypothetical protein